MTKKQLAKRDTDGKIRVHQYGFGYVRPRTIVIALVVCAVIWILALTL